MMFAMINGCLPALLAASAAGLTLYGQAATPVTSAKLHVARRAVPELVVQITNHRTSPLVEYAVRITSPRGGGIANWRKSPWSHTGEPAIEPGETRELRVSDLTAVPEQAIAAVILADFADGYYEGDEEFLRDTFATRARRAEDLRYWIAAIAAMPDGSNEASARYIRAAAERQPATGPGSRSEIAGQLALDYVERPPGWIAQVVRRRVVELREALTAETRHLTRLAEAGISSVQVREGQSLSIRVHPVPGVQIVASLENRASVPLDAWAIAAYNENGRFAGGHTTDTCGAARPRAGSIQPGDTREIGVLGRVDINDQRQRRFELSMALFRDGRVEGSREEHQRLLAARAERSCR
jgi:hypothetical protein